MLDSGNKKCVCIEVTTKTTQSFGYFYKWLLINATRLYITMPKDY